MHPRALDSAAPLFPAFNAVPLRVPHIRKRGLALYCRVVSPLRSVMPSLSCRRPGSSRPPATRQAAALAELSVDEVLARLTLDWNAPMRLDAFHKQVWAPAALRANRIAVETGTPGEISVTGPPTVTMYALRHTYASLSAAARIKPLALSRRIGHAAVTMTMNVYAHLYRESAADDMAALSALAVSAPIRHSENVIQLRR